MKLEVQFQVEIYFRKDDRYRLLGDVSPVVRTLAREQFDDYVKRVRIFVHPRLARELQTVNAVPQVLSEVLDDLSPSA